MINKSVKLNDMEQDIVKDVAKKRALSNRSNDIANAKKCEDEDCKVELDSFGAEVAFCKLFNVYPDYSIFPRSSSNRTDKGDAVVNDLVVDIKQTKYPSGKLIVAPWKVKNSTNIDCYGLMIGEFPEYVFKGFIESCEITKPEKLGNLGRGMTYIAKQNELKEIDSLKTLKNKEQIKINKG